MVTWKSFDSNLRLIISILCSHCHNVIYPSIYDNVGIFRCWHCQIWLREDNVIQEDIASPEIVEAVNEASKEYQTQLKNANETTQDINGIRAEDKPIINQVQIISQSRKNMKTEANESITCITESNKITIEQITASTEMIGSQLIELTATLQAFKDLALSLKYIMEKIND